MADPLPATLTVVPLPPVDHPNGRRYGPRDREAAYAAWRTVHGRSGRKTAEAIGASPQTIADWARADGWKARADAEDRDENAAARASVRAQLLPVVARGVARLARIIDDEAAAPMAVVRAVELAANMAGVGPISARAGSLAPYDDDRPRPGDGQALSAAELVAQAVASGPLARYLGAPEPADPAPAPA